MLFRSLVVGMDFFSSNVEFCLPTRKGKSGPAANSGSLHLRRLPGMELIGLDRPVHRNPHAHASVGMAPGGALVYFHRHVELYDLSVNRRLTENPKPP